MRIVIHGLALFSAAAAHAFCGFFVAGSDAKLINDASQVVLVRKDNHTVMRTSVPRLGLPGMPEPERKK